MRKILCLVLSLFMILPSVAFAADVKTVHVEGGLEKTVNMVNSNTTITVKDSTGKVVYSGKIDIDADLQYKSDFEVEADISDCTINVKQGDKDINKSIESAYYVQSATCSFDISDENKNKIIETDEFVKSAAVITDKYGNGGKCRVVVLFYDANNKMISCEEFQNGPFTFYDVNGEINIPENTSKIKAFMWKDVQTIIPVSKVQKKAADDNTFGEESEKTTVAFMGDSLTYGAQYMKVIEHYYQTRYPDRDIMFVNKGISGNSFSGVIGRFDWDITEHELTGDIDEATICLGFNDLRPQLYIKDVDYDNLGKNPTDEIKKSADSISDRINTYSVNCKQLVQMCKDKGIALTLLTPVVFDHAMVDSRVAMGSDSSFNFPEGVNDNGLRRMTDEIKAIGKKYNLPVIDIFTSTSVVTDSVRAEYNLADYYPIVTGIDGVHPEEQGGFYISYQFIKQQDDNCAIVAKVEIDAKTGAKSTEKADILVTDYSSDRVEYEYLAHAIPIANTKYYQKWENWGVPVTEDINNEIIKVTNLDAGTYSITIEGNTLTKNYSANELSEGVNIAIDANNPAQIQSVEAHKIAVSKVSHETSYRAIATTEQGIRNHPEVDISKFSATSTNEELGVLGSYSGSYRNYFTDKETNFGSKKYEVENWAKIRAEEQTAKDMSKPVQRTVVIKKIQ